jgi:riboflavin transporter FmnP
MTNWLVIGGFGIYAFLNPETTGIGFVTFFIAGCIHLLINWIFKKYRVYRRKKEPISHLSNILI